MSVRATTKSPKTPPSAGLLKGGSLGPLADLETHLPEEWWHEIFDALYLMTDGDVVENDANTTREVDALVAATGLTADAHILDLCCGQGRHVLELARRGFTHVTGLDRSKFLIRLARRRAKSQKLTATFKEGDARHIRLAEASQDSVAVMGNSFGYFSSQNDDSKVLRAIARVLKSTGTIVLDLTDGQWVRENFTPRSWEWIDQHNFVCRERELSKDGQRLVCREVVVHDERGVIADQFYAERLYTKEGISQLLRAEGFRELRFHTALRAHSERDQDLGMMAHRMVITARAPERSIAAIRSPGRTPLDIAVLLGDPRLPDEIKRDGAFNEEDFDTVKRLKEALEEIKPFRFRYIDNHATMMRDLCDQPPDLIFNLCDEGWNNDPFKELHVPAFLETLCIPYTGAGPACLGLCYDKSLVRSLAMSLDIPVPLETFVKPGDQSATLPSTFPAIIKPNFGDSSFGITKNAVVENSAQLLDYLEKVRHLIGAKPVLVQEFLDGDEYTVGLVGNPATGLSALAILKVDFSGLPADLPRILGYESKWDPASPYWTRVKYEAADLPADVQNSLIDQSSRLFERLCCRDYARFDFRSDRDGTIKLLEVNPNPGWCWDGKMNLMAELGGLSYTDFLGQILDAALERVGREKATPRIKAAGRAPGQASA